MINILPLTFIYNKPYRRAHAWPSLKAECASNQSAKASYIYVFI